MSKKFLTSIDLNKNEIQNVVIHKLATAPSTPGEGQIYYNTSDKRYYLRTDTAWKDITGRIDDILTTTNAITITDNADGTYQIEIANVNGSNAGLMTSADKTKLDASTNAATNSTIVERDASGDVAVNVLNAVNVEISAMGSNTTSAATKGYVDGLASTGVAIQGAIDASTNPNYPVATEGQAWHISVAGLIGGGSGLAVEIGDMIVAVAGNAGGTQAAVGASWIIMQSNLDAASETVAGSIRIATTAEVTTATDDLTAVTPSKMAAYVASLVTAGKFAADVGNGVATDIVVNHALGTSDVAVTVRDTTTKELVECDVVVTDTNNVTLSFTVAPTSNAYRVVIQG